MRRSIAPGVRLSRKPFSIVKPVLHANCSAIAESAGLTIIPENATFCSWKPFEGENYGSLFGTLDLVYLFAYSVCLFIAGNIADLVDLRYFLGIGAILSGLTTILFGLAYFLDIHSYTFFVITQLLGGASQASGYPAIVASFGNWAGKSSRGLIMGIWTSHRDVGTVLGSLIAGAFVEYAWGWSFIVPGLIIGGLGILTILLHLPYPEDVGLKISPQNTTMDEDSPVYSKCKRRLLDCGASGGRPISICGALRIPGVVEFALSLFFIKLVTYTFMFWLPQYIYDRGGFHSSSSAYLSSFFDLGGLVGTIVAGIIHDKTGTNAVVCVAMFIIGLPTLLVFYWEGTSSVGSCIGLLIPLGFFINGPFSLITSVVSADLGTHPSLEKNSRALATVSGIINGTGSLGAALGPLLCGILKPVGWWSVFVMLFTSLILGILLLSRLVKQEICTWIRDRRNLTVPEDTKC
ncbi:unnamed protein product [Calicophoron daubneyi]|uniref:Sugar phosphate exchanger 3 n=1 Tax=Calicophoron daubneyi TaxID=300641 RepID=A0AAV2U1B7_CALDB